MSTLTKMSVTSAFVGVGLMLGGCASPTDEAEALMDGGALPTETADEAVAPEETENVGTVSSEIVYGPGFGAAGPGYGYGAYGPSYGYGYYGPGYGLGYGGGLGYGISRGYGVGYGTGLGYGVTRGYRSYRGFGTVGGFGGGYGGYGGYGVLW